MIDVESRDKSNVPNTILKLKVETGTPKLQVDSTLQPPSLTP